MLGNNLFGQIGDGSGTNRLNPVFVNTTESFVSITVGYSHTCGLLSNGSAMCWGKNNFAQIGNGSAGGDVLNPILVNTTETMESPVIGNATNVASGSYATTIWAGLDEGRTYLWRTTVDDSNLIVNSPIWKFTTSVAPSMNTSRIYSPLNSTLDDLVGYCNATDEDADNVSYFYGWYKNDELFSHGSLSNYTGAATQVGYLKNESSMEYPTSVYVLGNYVYVTSNSKDSLTIIDISIKSTPTQVGYISSSMSMDLPRSVFVLGDYAYVASSDTNSLTIINVSDKTSPTQVGYITNDSMSDTRSVYVLGDYAYVASSWNDSLTIVNVSNKSNPTLVSYLSNSSSMDALRSVYVSGDYAYVVSTTKNSLTIIDVSTKSSPIQVGYLSNSSSMTGANSVHVSGDYVYVASGDKDSLTIINVSDKTSPTQVGYLTNETSMDGAGSVYVSGDYAFVASSDNNSLTIINISDKTSPAQIGYMTNETSIYYAWFVYVSGDYAYVISYLNHALTIIDVADGFTQNVEINVNNILSSELSVDDEWIFSCRAYDNVLYSSWLNSSGLTILDTTVPTIQVQSPINTTYNTSTVYFNATVDEAVDIWILNYNGTNTTLTINTSLEVEDGNTHHLLLYVNDSAGNVGLNDSIYFSVDTTAPTATFTCSPSSVTVSGTVACTCSVADGGSGVNTSVTSYTSNPSTTSAGTFTLTCTFEDLAGNSGSATASYTVESSGVAPTASAPTESHSWTEVTPDQPAVMEITEPGLDLTTITITMTETVQDVSLTVTTVDVLPQADLEIGLSSGESYQAFKIDTTNIDNENIESVIIDFKVNKTWIEEQGGIAENIILYRSEEGVEVWSILNTTLIYSDADYYYFSAVSPGFSIFVVVIDLSICNNNGVCETEIGEDESNCPNDCKVIVEKKGFFETIKSYLWTGIVFVLVIVMGLVILFIRSQKGKKSRRKRKK